MRSTHTFAALEVSAGTYDEIRAKLEAAGYDHAFVGDAIDMHGIGLTRADDHAQGRALVVTDAAVERAVAVLYPRGSAYRPDLVRSAIEAAAEEFARVAVSAACPVCGTHGTCETPEACGSAMVNLCPQHGVTAVTGCAHCAADITLLAQVGPDDVPKRGDWRIDHTAGRPILVYQNCSVIEDEQAHYVLRLIERDTAPTPAGWQPIDTAPRDGRQMILLLTPSGWPQVAWSNTWWTAGFSVECKPTRWMPIPPTQGLADA